MFIKWCCELFLQTNIRLLWNISGRKLKVVLSMMVVGNHAAQPIELITVWLIRGCVVGGCHQGATADSPRTD